jgi:hypothetical protein
VDVTADDTLTVSLADPGAPPVDGNLGALRATTLCVDVTACHIPVPIAAAGRYALVLAADAPGIQYTLRATAQ